MELVRTLVLKTLQINIIFKTEYINTKLNAIADSISRCQWLCFWALVPNADPTPTQLPQEFWKM